LFILLTRSSFGVAWHSWDVARQIPGRSLGVNPHEDHSAIGVGAGGNDLDDLWRDLPLVLDDMPLGYPLIKKILQQLSRDLLGRCSEQAMHMPSLLVQPTRLNLAAPLFNRSEFLMTRPHRFHLTPVSSSPGQL
jgi:hypothetical protein